MDYKLVFIKIAQSISIYDILAFLLGIITAQFIVMDCMVLSLAFLYIAS